MLHLVTGTPGAGKTLFTLSAIYGDDGAKELDRPVLVDGIETDLPHESIDGQRWHLDAPDGAIIVIDEAQRVFRPRARGAAVPDYFSALETHRHRGIDIWLITQDAYLVDAHVRRLVGEYFRIDRPGSMRYMRVRRYEEVPSYDNKNGPIETLRKAYPKKLFSRYKSTTMDTHRAKIPIKFWIYGAFLLLAVTGIGFVLWKLFSGSMLGDPGEGVGDNRSIFQRANEEISGSARGLVDGGVSFDAVKISTLFEPAVVGQPWTAPAYVELLVEEPVPPLPAACVVFSSRERVGRITVEKTGGSCRCYTDRAVRLDVTEEFCRRFVERGWHDPTGGRFRVRDELGVLQYADPADVPGSRGSGSAGSGLVRDGPGAEF